MAAIKVSKRIVNIVGGRRGVTNHGAFAADAYRRFRLKSPDVSMTTYSHIHPRGPLSPPHFKGMRDVLQELEAGKVYTIPSDPKSDPPSSDIDIKKFSEISFAFEQYVDNLGEIEEKDIIVHITGNGRDRDGKIECGTNGPYVGPEIFDHLREEQRILAVIDGCRGNMWIKDVPSNVSLISAYFTSCLSTHQRIQDEHPPFGTLIQWAMDSALSYKQDEMDINWVHHFKNNWDQICWAKPSHRADAKLHIHNIEPWIDLLPLFYDKNMDHSPIDPIADETHMVSIDILERLDCRSWEQVYELSRSVDVLNVDMIDPLSEQLRTVIPSISLHDANAAVKYALIKGIRLGLPDY